MRLPVNPGTGVRIPPSPPQANCTNTNNILEFVFFFQDYFGIFLKYDKLKK